MKFPGNSQTIYLATAREIDQEMSKRIERHKKDRPSHWKTIEEPLNIVETLRHLKEEKSTIILDCLTLLNTNLLFEKCNHLSPEESQKYILDYMDLLIQEASKLNGELIIISNLVENSLVSEYQWTRMFQDITGLVHQKLAASSKEVYVLTAGIPQRIK
jgi:adenosylcobinamide kinase / adenosylcobinamide-phosphate guanylyltransferase